VSLPPDGTVEVTRPRAGRAVPLAVVISCAVVVAVLGIGVRTSFAPLLRLDAAVLDALYAGDNRPKALNVLLQLLTAPGGTVVRVVLFLPVLVLLLRRRAWWTAAWVSVTILGIGPLTRLLKDFFGRVRPPYAQGGARLDSLSFPSGHSSGIATLVMVGLLLAWPLLSAHARRWSVLAGAALVVLVGLTRMWLGVHYPSDVLAGWALGIAWTLFTALLFDALPGGRAALSGGGAAPPRMTGLRQHVVLAPDDGSLGPLLRIADDRLAAGTGYGRHPHRAVDVVAVVLAGSVRHSWGGDAVIAAGDVAVLRAGRGLEHDEVAGDDGARVLQCYLRPSAPDAAPSHVVRRQSAGWVDLGRGDARLWLAPAAGTPVDVPPGLLLTVGDEVTVEQQAGGTVHPDTAATLLVWQLDAGRPSWARV